MKRRSFVATRAEILTVVCAIGALFAIDYSYARGVRATRVDAERASANGESPGADGGSADLSVHYISRLPRRPKSVVEYDPPAYNGHLSAESAAMAPWPTPGETVRFVAHVENQGTGPSRPVVFRWLVDGDERGRDTIPALLAGEAFETTLPWVWQDEIHTVRFELDHTDPHPENDALWQWTNAIMFTVYAWPGFESWMAEHANAIGTYSAMDWIQFEANEMNRLFVNSTSELAPDGVLLRIAIDRIVRVSEATPYVGGHEPPETCPTEVCWSFGGPDQGLLPWLEEVNRGRDVFTMHEWGYALGLIELTEMDVHDVEVLVTDDGTPVAGTDLLPRIEFDVLRYNGVSNDLMSGATPYALAPYHAWALNTDASWERRGLPLRRGWMGRYLSYVPETNVVRLTRGGAPLAGADIEVFHQEDGFIPDVVKFEGSTDRAGRFVFPSATTLEYAEQQGRHEPIALVSPFSTVFSVHPNVFGTNGVLLMRITAPDGERSYRFLDVTQFNLEYARGHTEVGTYEVDVGAKP
jgi:hypothetical protein